jgi:hypothetical protein
VSFEKKKGKHKKQVGSTMGTFALVAVLFVVFWAAVTWFRSEPVINENDFDSLLIS